MRRVTEGFTLIELILVILVLGIVSTSITSFIRFGAEIYQDVSGRDKQISESRFVIERITREIRNAVPNSVRVSSDGTCVEFIPILASSSYVDIPVLPDDSIDTVTIIPSDKIFDFDNNTFNPAFNTTNTKLVVYPLTESDVYGGSIDIKLFDINTYSVNNDTPIPVDYKLLDLTFNNSALPNNEVLFSDDSPTERYFIIRDSVAYCQGTDNTIKRFQGHDFTGTQATPPTGTGVLMAERQSTPTPFTFKPATLSRTGIVVMDFTFTYDDEILRQVNEVHVANVP